MSPDTTAYTTCSLSNFRTYECPISPKTSWLFLEVIAEDESIVSVKFLISGSSRRFANAAGYDQTLMGLSVSDAINAVSARQRRLVAEVPRILLSGIEQALIDLRLSLWAFLLWNLLAAKSALKLRFMPISIAEL